MLARKLGAISFVAMLLSSGISYSDDTELYVFESSSRTGARPKVLVIFDNSGSMGTIEQNAPGGYDPNYEQEDGTPGYPAVGNSHAYQGRMLYFTKGTGIDNTTMPVPDSPSEARRFLDSINGCNKSKESLDKYGRFTGYLREFVTRGKSGEWDEVPNNNGANIEIIDCWEDIDAADPINATGVNNGFPVDGLRSGKNAVAYNHDDGNGDWSQAIADAKAVKETALANAKLALEEAFTPKLQSMISAKLAEELDDEELQDEELDVAEEPVIEDELGDEEEVVGEDEMEVHDEDVYEEEEELEMDDEEELDVVDDEEDELDLELVSLFVKPSYLD